MEHSKEVNDCKHLIKTLIMGNKFSFVIILFELVFEISMYVELLLVSVFQR